MNRQKILITGAGGFIGGGLFHLLKEYIPIGVDIGIPRDNQNTSFLKIDLSDKDKVDSIFNKFRPDIVFHLAALTSPQRNEENMRLAKLYNLGVTQNIVANITEDMHLIFLSTDKIFDGSDPYPNEETAPKPLGIYAEHKLTCEKMVRESVKKYHIFRLPIVHSYGESKAVSTEAGPGSFLDKAINDLKQDKQVTVFDNVYRCFVKRQELLKLFELILNDTHYGVYHIGSKMMSYSERLHLLCDEIGLSYEGLLMPVKGEARPMKQNLDTRKLKETFGYSVT